MSRFISKLSDRFSASSSGDEGGAGKKGGANVSARRREQIRRAQKTHRERKAEYLKELEVEVDALRVKEAANTSSMQTCMAMIDILKKALIAKGIEIPIEYNALQARLERPPTASIEVLGGESGRPQRLRAVLPTSASSPATDEGPCDLQDPQKGIDFVLTLENPCIPHFHGAPSDDGDGHKMQFQAPIIARAPQSRGTSSQVQGFASGATWTIPTSELDNQLQRLLIYSQNLSLNGELTPVMAWKRIQEHPQAGAMTSPKLEWLTSAVAATVTCQGFGAVVDEETFEQLLDQALRGE